MTDMWTREKDDDGILWLGLEVSGKSANTLDGKVLEAFSAALAAVESERPKGLVIYSRKQSGFIAGADVEALDALDSEALRELIEDGKKVLDRLQALTCPTVAMIHGHCLGGGLEVALACDRRVAREDTRAGLPEVRLGLIPGLGGVSRLIDLVGAAEGMKLMLTGKQIDARKGKAMGLFDEVAEERHLSVAARHALDGDGAGGFEQLKKDAMDSALARPVLARRMRGETQRRVRRQHYPAPYRLIDIWETHGTGEKLKQAETEAFLELAATDTSKNLRRVFMLREDAKHRARKHREDMTIHRVHVIGAGAMGGDIAAWSALRGFEVTLTDKDNDQIAAAMKAAARLFETEQASVTDDLRSPRDRFIPDPDGEGAKSADLIIEALPEKLDLKQEVFKEIEPRLKDGALIATNTSSLKLEDIGEALEQPGRLVGLHFFNPATKMPLVEAIHADATEAVAHHRAMAFADAVNKIPVACRDSTGFIVNRALTPYLLEASRMLEEGVEAEVIDAAAEAFGMAQGPVEVADSVGLEVALEVAEQLQHAFPREVGDIPMIIERNIADQRTGRKSGKGFYDYDDDGRPRKAEAGEISDEQRQAIADRLILPLLNTCMACLRDGVAESADQIDAALIFGAGFAPFRGGPLNYAKARGIDDIVSALESLKEEHGERFTPDAGWSELAS